MTTKTENKTNGRLLSLGLLLSSVVILAMTVGLGARTWQAWQQPEPMDVNTVEENREAILEKVMADDKEAAETLKKMNFFVSEAPKQNPIRSVSGCIGNEAIINGKPYKVGDKVGDAEILAIEATYIKYRWDDKEHTVAPIASNGGGSSSSGPPSRSGGAVRMPSMTSKPSTSLRVGGGSVMRLSPEERKGMKEKMKTMSPEEKRDYLMEMRSR